MRGWRPLDSGAVILEASSSTSPASHSLFPLCLRCAPGVQNFLMDWAALSSVPVIPRVAAWRSIVLSSPFLSMGFLSSLGSRRGATAISTSHAGVRLRYQRLQTLRRPCYRLLRHRSVRVVGTCCTRPWCQGACVRSEQLATLFSQTVCPEQLTSDPPCVGIKKQWVVKVAMDAWLATAGLRGGQVLEVSSRTFTASHPLLPSGSAVPQGPVQRDGLGSSVVSPCYAVSGGMIKYLVIFTYFVPTPRGVAASFLASCRGSGFDIAASLLPVVAAPVFCATPPCLHPSRRDLLHSALSSRALVSGRRRPPPSHPSSHVGLTRRIGGALGCVHRVGLDGWQTPVPRGVNTGGGASSSTSSANHHMCLPPTVVAMSPLGPGC